MQVNTLNIEYINISVLSNQIFNRFDSIQKRNIRMNRSHINIAMNIGNNINPAIALNTCFTLLFIVFYFLP